MQLYGHCLKSKLQLNMTHCMLFHNCFLCLYSKAYIKIYQGEDLPHPQIHASGKQFLTVLVFLSFFKKLLFIFGCVDLAARGLS